MVKVQVERIHSLTGHRDAIYTIQPSANDGQFFSGAGDGMVVRWDLNESENGELIAKLPNSIYSLHYHVPTDLLIAGHNYEGIHLLDWKNKKEIGSLQFTKAAIFDIQPLDEGVIVSLGDGSVVMVDINTLSVVSRAQFSEKSARCVASSKKNHEVAVGYSDNFIRVFDTSLKLKCEWQAHGNSVFTMKYTPDGNYLISGSRDARLKVWDVQAGYTQATEVVAHMYAINDLCFSPDGKHFVTCSMDKSIKVWDAEQFKLLKVIDRARHAGHSTSVNKLLWTRFNNYVLSASDDRTISVWKIIF